MVALAFAIGVERVAARDMGYDTASDEIDLLEIHGDYPRAHLTRMVSLYTTGRSRFPISYPNDPTALALPFDNGRSIRGEEVSSSTLQSFPVPSLHGLHGSAPQSVDVPGGADAGALPVRSGWKVRGATAACRQRRRARAAGRDLDRRLAEAERDASASWERLPRAATVAIDETASHDTARACRVRPGPRREPVLDRAADELGSPRGKPG